MFGQLVYREFVCKFIPALLVLIAFLAFYPMANDTYQRITNEVILGIKIEQSVSRSTSTVHNQHHFRSQSTSPRGEQDFLMMLQTIPSILGDFSSKRMFLFFLSSIILGLGFSAIGQIFPIFNESSSRLFHQFLAKGLSDDFIKNKFEHIRKREYESLKIELATKENARRLLKRIETVVSVSDEAKIRLQSEKNNLVLIQTFAGGAFFILILMIALFFWGLFSQYPFIHGILIVILLVAFSIFILWKIFSFHLNNYYSTLLELYPEKLYSESE